MASSVVRPHVPEEELHAYCDGELSPPQRVEIAEHLLGCLICRSQHAEVMELRARTSSLLAVAAPRTIRRPAQPVMPRQSVRRRLPGITAAAAAAVIGVGLWFSLQPDPGERPGSQFASALGAPAFLGVGSRDSDQAARAREQALLSEPAATPNVLPNPGSGAHAPRMANPVIDVDPVVTPEWKENSWGEALAMGGGSLASIPGLQVAAVRVHTNADRSRPTFMVRQLLADGRPIWVVEGLVDVIAPVYQLLQTTGIAVSTAARVKTEYVAANGRISRPARMMVVIGRLPADSLNVLAAKVR